jgi:hypothetical protein
MVVTKYRNGLQNVSQTENILMQQEEISKIGIEMKKGSLGKIEALDIDNNRN